MSNLHIIDQVTRVHVYWRVYTNIAYLTFKNVMHSS